jgi:hypothetical protein
MGPVLGAAIWLLSYVGQRPLGLARRNDVRGTQDSTVWVCVVSRPNRVCYIREAKQSRVSDCLINEGIRVNNIQVQVVGRRNHGLTWVEDLALAEGLGPLTPSLSPGGTDFAYGGAETGVTPAGIRRLAPIMMLLIVVGIVALIVLLIRVFPRTHPCRSHLSRSVLQGCPAHHAPASVHIDSSSRGLGLAPSRTQGPCR